MAKKRFNLNETMLDARQGIEEARANAEKAGEESAATQERQKKRRKNLLLPSLLKTHVLKQITRKRKTSVRNKKLRPIKNP